MKQKNVDIFLYFRISFLWLSAFFYLIRVKFAHINKKNNTFLSVYIRYKTEWVEEKLSIPTDSVDNYRMKRKTVFWGTPYLFLQLSCKKTCVVTIFSAFRWSVTNIVKHSVWQKKFTFNIFLLVRCVESSTFITL